VPAGSTHAKLDAKGRYRNVRLGRFAPVQLTGKLTGKGRHKGANLAFAVNGRIVATAPTVSEHRGGTQAFAAMIPEETLREGANDVRVYAIVGGTRLRRLT
jgi:hypothetical protein